MMNLFCGGQLALLLTLLTQRMRGDVAVADALPGSAIASAGSWVAVVLFIALRFQLLVFLTEPAVGELRTARV